MKNNNLDSSGLTLVNKKEEIQLVNNRKLSDSGNVKCYIFILSDALLNIIDWELESVTNQWNCHTFLIYKNTLLTMKRTNQGTPWLLHKRSNIDGEPVVWLNLSKFILILKIDILICHNFFKKKKTWDFRACLCSISCKIRVLGVGKG